MLENMPDILRRLREEHEYKQDLVAKHLGVVQQTYSNYEKGCSALPLDYLIKLALFYDVSTDFLLGLTTFRRSPAELERSYLSERTLGEVASDMLFLSEEKRAILTEFLDYLLAKQKAEPPNLRRKHNPPRQ